MTVAQWFSFEGRIRRRTWLLGYVLPLIGISLLGSALDIGFGFMSVVEVPTPDGFSYETQGVGVFSLLALVPLFWGGLAGQVKRWHDRDKSGWWTLIALVPIIGGIWLLVELGILEGTRGANQYGSDPLA